MLINYSHKSALPRMTITPAVSSNLVKICAKSMSRRSKQGSTMFSWTFLQVTFAASEAPKALSEGSCLALHNRKWQLHFQISLNISSEKTLVIKRPSKVSGCYLDPIYLDLIWWLTGSSTRLKIRWYLSAEPSPRRCFVTYLNTLLCPMLHNMHSQW